MRDNTKNENKTFFAKPKRFIPFLLVVVLLIGSLSVYAWFYYSRQIAAVTEISNPTAIFINSGNQEDVRYLDLGGIDVEGIGDGYKDFVFCVRGNHVNSYRIQLAYTTNNQFDYELYTASVAADQASVPSNPTGVVIYDLHDGTDSTLYYYAPSGATPIAMHPLNLDTGSDEKIALNNDTYHDRTYTPEGAGSPYTNRQKYAIPLYWWSDNAFFPVHDSHANFCDYYILRVKWSSQNRNDKETDIVYIAAKNVSS